MPLFRPSSIRLAHTASSATRVAAKKALASRAPPAPFPTIPKCPSPICECLAMPEGLDIDTSSSLNGTMAPYSRHILVFTGQADWKSKIEDEHFNSTWGPYLAHLKKAFGRNGKYHDPYKNVLISASSWSPSDASAVKCRAIIFPSFQHRSYRPATDNDAYNEHLEEFVDLVQGPEEPQKSTLMLTGEIQYPTILICSHNSRDSRCGVLGPVLYQEFGRVLRQQPHSNGLPFVNGPTSQDFAKDRVNVGMISHIGGHKWAGNVILYLPPSWRIATSSGNGSKTQSPLAGSGIWYGRVEPKHVEGIVEETILNGRVIQELFRGGIDGNGQTLRLP